MVTVDEASRFKRVYGVKTRAETHKILKPLRNAYAADGVIIKTIRGDGAGELGRNSYFLKTLTKLKKDNPNDESENSTHTVGVKLVKVSHCGVRFVVLEYTLTVSDCLEIGWT